MTLPKSADGSIPAAADSEDSAFRALIRTFGLLERVMNPYFAAFGISGAQWGALRCLYRAQQENRESVTVTELSQRLLIRPPSVTGVVDRLVRDGLVSRQAPAADMRVRQIRLTSKGRQIVEQVLAGHAGQLRRVMSGLTDAEQTQMHRLLVTFEKHLRDLLQSENR
jgi:DNA-binding MarR family transcriptional regulator